MKFESKAKLCGVALALLISAGAAQAGDAAKGLGYEKWHPWFEVGGYGSNERSRGEAVMFAPLWQSATALAFTDIRGKFFEKGEFEGNVALGLRAMQPSGWNLGAWVGWDVRHTEYENTFNQVSFGFEVIRSGFDARLNGYVPTDDNAFVERSDAFAALLAGNSIFVRQTTDIVREYALYGIDGEIGFRLPLERLSADAAEESGRGVPRHELRLYGGGFWFDQDDFREEVAGPRARLEWRINDVIQPILGSRLTIEADYQYDDIRDHQLEVGARLRIPFGGGGRDARNAALARLNGQERRMMDGLERDPDIVVERQTDRTETLEAAIDNETNVRFDRVAYVGDGDALQATLNATGQNSLVLLTGGTLAGGDVTTLANQTLQGGASTIFIRGARTGVVVPFTAPGTKPTVQGGGGLDVLIIGGDNVHIAGLGIDGRGGTSDDGIDGDNDLSNIVLQQNMITNTGDDGIDFDFGNRNIRVFNNMITNAGEDGIDFEGFNSDITITGNRINLADGGSDKDGIDFGGVNSQVTISKNVISVGSNIIEGDGIDFEDFNSSVTIANNTITVGDNNNGGDGIEFSDDNSGITITGNTITVGNGSEFSDGIFFDDFNNNIEIADNIISIGINKRDSDGIYFDDFNTNIAILSNAITVGSNSDDGNGIQFFGDNNFITIANNVIRTGDADPLADGIELLVANFGVSITGNTITSGNLGNGITIGNAGIGGSNVVMINDNLFNGPGNAVFNFDFPGNTANGGGNIAAPVPGFTTLCRGLNNFTGTLEVNGVDFVNGAGCN